ncbi:MAG: hypothetical protein MRY83_03830, partial [Flavobacteriales bacterium]|nr:hypothetical protein [Flavobacteriales bacterium]
TIKLKNVDLLEFIPTVPKHIRQDEYLSKICLLNQEWNRNQVAFDQKAIGSNYALGDISISRIDLARNCLNSYLWELIFYTVDNGKKQVLYHGWFDFPKDLYASLFEGRNIIPFENCRAYMEQWQHPGSEKIELSLMRDIKEEQEIPFRVLNDVMYPLQGERKKKEREIISPLNYTSMQDFLTDSTTFATFTPPGFYNRADPRKTELSRFKVLNKVIKRTTINQPTKQEMMELEFQFDDGSGKMTKFLIGGINPHEFPVLEIEDCNKGQMYSMGIANHPFYETYGDHEKNRIEASTYFSFLLDKDNKWLDSHTVGIDGPLFHKDAEGKLHLWMLSFERHALVSHFELDT